MFFEKNIAALATTGNDLLGKQLETTPLESFVMYETEAGDYTLEYQGIPLHSPSGAVAEAQRLVAENCTAHASRVHVVLGLGVGYVLDAAFEFSPGKVVVYEPDLSLIRFIFEHVDLSRYLESGRVQLFANQRDLRTFVRRNISCVEEQIDVVVVPNQAAILANEIETLMPSLVEVVHDRVSDYKTVQMYHEPWIRSFMQNVFHYDKVLPPDVLAGRYADKPALIVSPGPSLGGAIEAIKQLKDSVVIIAVNLAVVELAKHDIAPDFAVFYDATEVDKMIQKVPPHIMAKTTLIAGFLAHSRCYETMAKSVIYLPTVNNIQFCDWLDDTLGTREQRLEGGGTVSLVAFQVGQLMGCNPLVLVGQDLAYPNNQCYVTGGTCEMDERGRLNITYKDMADDFPQLIPILMKGQDGKPILSSTTFLRFIRHFEDLAERNQRLDTPIRLYNASIGGVHIEGFETRPLDCFVGELPTWKTPEQFDFPSENPMRAIRQSRLRQGVRRLKRLVEETLAFLEQVESGFSMDENNLAARLMQVNQRLLAFCKKDSLLSYLLFFEMGEYDRQYRFQPSTPEDVAHNARAMMTFCTGGRQTLQRLFPYIEEAYQRFAQAETAGCPPKPQRNDAKTTASTPPAVVTTADSGGRNPS